MRATFLVLACVAALAAASCPNSCSGHGRCNPGDICECFRQADDRTPAYIGPDCSQRVCPTGRAFGSLSDLTDDVAFIAFDEQTKFNGEPQAATSTPRLSVDTHDYALTRTATFMVRVLATTASTVDIQWKLDEHDKYSQTITANAGSTAFANMVELTDTNALLPSFGSSLATGVNIWFSSSTNVQENNLYTFTVNYRGGKSHSRGEPNSAHQFIECSGKGECDRTSGKCGCADGYGGDACQRIKCPADCSGHGVCQTLKRFVADAEDPASPGSLFYSNAWDAEKAMTCLCDVGYRGPDCSMIECPSGGDPMGGAGGLGVDVDDNMVEARDCSGRGVCDYSSGMCECFSGYTGERCEVQTTFV